MGNQNCFYKFKNRVVHLLAEASEAKPALFVKKRNQHIGERLNTAASDWCVWLNWDSQRVRKGWLAQSVGSVVFDTHCSSATSDHFRGDVAQRNPGSFRNTVPHQVACVFPMASVTDYHRLSGLKQQRLFRHSSRGRKSGIKVLAGPHSLKEANPGPRGELLFASCSFWWPRAFLGCGSLTPLSASVCPHVPSSLCLSVIFCLF